MREPPNLFYTQDTREKRPQEGSNITQRSKAAKIQTTSAITTQFQPDHPANAFINWLEHKAAENPATIQIQYGAYTLWVDFEKPNTGDPNRLNKLVRTLLNNVTSLASSKLEPCCITLPTGYKIAEFNTRYTLATILYIEFWQSTNTDQQPNLTRPFSKNDLSIICWVARFGKAVNYDNKSHDFGPMKSNVERTNIFVLTLQPTADSPQPKSQKNISSRDIFYIRLTPSIEKTLKKMGLPAPKAHKHSSDTLRSEPASTEHPMVHPPWVDSPVAHPYHPSVELDGASPHRTRAAANPPNQSIKPYPGKTIDDEFLYETFARFPKNLREWVSNQMKQGMVQWPGKSHNKKHLQICFRLTTSV